MARVATIAIHAIVMLATKDLSHPFELDSISGWFILSEVAVATPIMLSWAPALEGSKARILIRIWAVFVFVGAICGFVVVKWASTHVDERTCPVGVNPDASIEYTRREIFSKLGSGALLGRFDIAAVAAASFGLWLSLRSDGFATGRKTSKIVRALVRYTDLAGLMLSSGVLIAIIVLHERYLLGSPKLPMLLPVTSYEQWNCWAAAGLIVLATILNWILGKPKDSEVQSAQIGIDFTWTGHRDANLLASSAADPWSVSQDGSSSGRWNSTTEKPWLGRKSDMEWAGVIGRPTPSHVS